MKAVTSLRGLLASVAVASGLFSGCSSQKAAQAPEAREPQVTSSDAAPEAGMGISPGTTTPATLDEATRELDSAEKALVELFPQATPDGGQTPESMASEGRCVDVCRALESMKRARDHVCKLAEGEPLRCESANERVERAKARAVAACPTCS